jgi:hypothetical protein
MERPDRAAEEGKQHAAVKRFRQALKAAPDDLMSTFNLAQPYGGLAGKAKVLRRSIARRDLRADQPDGLRQDAVSYCILACLIHVGMVPQAREAETGDGW